MVDRWCTKLAYAALFGHFSKFNAKLQDKSENIHRQNLGVYGQAFPVAWGFETGLHGHVPTSNSCTKGSQRACCFCLTPSDIKIKVGRLFSMCGWHWGLLLNLRPIQPGILNGELTLTARELRMDHETQIWICFILSNFLFYSLPTLAGIPLQFIWRRTEGQVYLFNRTWKWPFPQHHQAPRRHLYLLFVCRQKTITPSTNLNNI